jgi:esterase/lipase superfamily enzyme
MKKNTVDTKEKFRVFVVATDAEWVSKDMLEQEIGDIRKEIQPDIKESFVFQSLTTFDPAVFIAAAKQFKPNIIHFTNRGSPNQFVRMFDKNGWIRRVSGGTLANYIEAIGVKCQFLFFSNCRVWRNEENLAMVSNYVVSLMFKRSVGIPSSYIEQLYNSLTSPNSLGKTINQIRDVLSVAIFTGDIYFKSYIYGDKDKLVLTARLDEKQRVSEESRGVGDEYGGPVFSRKVELFHLGHAGNEERQANDIGPRVYRVWFGTNRKPVNENDISAGFTSARAERVYYGNCDISIPKFHTMGSLGDPWWKRFPRFWQNNRLAVQGRQVLSASDYWLELQRVFKDLAFDDKTLLIFLHGYNVSFDSAALRAAQIGFDLGIKGTTAFYSWPSKGLVSGYPADVASLEASEKYIGAFISDLSQKSGANKVHIIAHSMGNRGLLRAFSQMFSRIEVAVGKPFEQIFLAAPDVDVELFKQMASIYQKVAHRTTMYVSDKDKALRSSGFLHDYPRAGYTPPVTVVPGIDTIEVSNIDLTFLGHGYVAEARPILSDMHSLIAEDKSPDNRFGMEIKYLAPNMKYWCVRK